ncbi:MAG: chorismate synthase, partial [Clostridia bacterium]|nr:chorismate synthase [Clostridia bacterium]
MKNTFGSSVSVTLFGESHGAEIGAVLDGLAPGIPV